MSDVKIKLAKRAQAPEMDELVDSLHDFFIRNRISAEEAFGCMANMIINLSLEHLTEDEFEDFSRLLIESYYLNLKNFKDLNLKD